MNEVSEEVLAGMLGSSISNELQKIENSTNRKTSIDSITISVPSSVLNTPQRNEIESRHFEEYRINRRL